ncbi:DUF4328 domain-containing protein [Myxococcus sp. MxC21-1]|uniref:DUF4328 domain-containing protein n=1 Tax=Myxococcus sp. MxC21-1 TaxID=3041439 RepID=UPI00292FEBAA|nr:DUF4328 domain-containing protein [Myxococcus sp. MxC21-1]WNZ60443.1 DUF4328 domain-containing protein [Myxococcus sp. MxC21-1]
MGVCVPCHARQLQSLPHTTGRAKWTLGGLYTGVAVAALTGLLHVWLYLGLEGGFTPSQENAETFDALNAQLVLASSIVSIVTAISFLRWQYLSVKVARATGVSTEEPRWAMVVWFIPIYNLVKPYAVMRDLWLNLGGAPARKVLLLGWWAAWLISNGTSNASASMFNMIESIPKIIPVLLIAGMIAEALNVLAAVLCIRVIKDIESMLVSRRAGLDAIIARADARTSA